VLNKHYVFIVLFQFVNYHIALNHTLINTQESKRLSIQH